MTEDKWLYHVGMEIEFPTLGKVSALEERGIGRFSTVFLGEDEQNRRFALKAYAPMRDLEACSEFAGSEQTFRGSIKGVCTPLDSVAIPMGGGRHGFVVAMPFVEDSLTLREWMDHEKLPPRSVEEAHMRLQVSKNMVRNLLNLHNNGYLHGDFSVNNILVNSNADVVLIDLQWLSPIGEPPLAENVGIGTRETVSPEMRTETGLRYFNTKSEVWSICRLILELLSCQAKDDFDSVEEIGVFNVADRVGGDAPLIDTPTPEYLSGDGWGVLLMGTAVNQISRPTLEEILQALESLKVVDIDHELVIQLAIDEGGAKQVVIPSSAIGVKVEFSMLGAVRCRIGKKRKLCSFGTNSGDLFLDLTKEGFPEILLDNNGVRFSKPLAHGLKLMKDGVLVDEIVSIEVN
tara:strand:- start:932 stop:2143 length:1212 start_codon:yes stop_codon:yes gene_type:complete